MNKTPYEIRYDLLTLAKHILSEQCMNERIRIENDWNAKCEMIRNSNLTGKQIDFPLFPAVPMITADKVVAMAEYLNTFISKND